MLRQRPNRNCGGQVFMEYTMIVGVIVMVLMAMNVTIKRGIQGMIKTVADQVGTQVNAEQKFDESGHLERAYTSARSSTDKTRREIAGVTNYIYSDSITTESTSVSNLGFQETN